MKNTNTTNALYVFEYSYILNDICSSHYHIAKENQDNRDTHREFEIGECETSCFGAEYGQYTLHAIVETVEDARAVIAKIAVEAGETSTEIGTDEYDFYGRHDHLVEVWRLDTVRVLSRDETSDQIDQSMRDQIDSSTTDDELESFAGGIEDYYRTDFTHDRMQLTDALEIATEYRDALIAEEL